MLGQSKECVCKALIRLLSYSVTRVIWFVLFLCGSGFELMIMPLKFHFYNVTNNNLWANKSGALTEIRNVLNLAFGLAQPQQQLDIAAIPNPFEGISGYGDSDQHQLRLLDGGIDGLNNPILPLLVPGEPISTLFHSTRMNFISM